MKFFKEHHCKIPEVHMELKKSELKMENLINKYRVFLITFLMIGDILVAHITGLYSHKYLHFGMPTLIMVYFGLYRLHKITKSEKPKPYLKYLTIVVDYLFITVVVFEMQHILPELLGLELKQIVLIASMLFMVVNFLSALRVQKKVIAISTVLGIVINSMVHLLFGSSIIVLIYSGSFILIIGVFNQYISTFIYHFYATNFRLNKTMEALSSANEEIKTQNEEINAQNDELSAQNDYLAKQRDEIAYQKKQITSSIQYASRIQQAVLNSPEEIENVVPDSFVLLKPKDIVSGDFYWFKELILSEQKLKIFTAVDCTGHGVPGAFMSMLGTTYLNEIIAEIKGEFSSAYILNRLREEVKKQLKQTSNQTEVKDGMDMALCAIDYDAMQVHYSGANNPLFIIRKTNVPASEVEEIKADKMPIGVYLKEGKTFTNNIINVNRGDLLYAFSDGIIDQFGGERNEKFKKRRFKQLLLDNAHLPLTDQKAAIEESLYRWMGEGEQIDDIIVIGVCI